MVLSAAGTAIVVALTFGISSQANADIPTYKIERTVAVSVLPVNQNPTDVAVDSQRDLVYVTARFSNQVLVFDGDLNFLRSIPVPSWPYRLDVGPTGVVYVSQYTGNDQQGSVAVILPNGTSVHATLDVGRSPVGVTISADGSRLWVANMYSSFLSVFDLSNPEQPEPLPNLVLPRSVETVIESPDGTALFLPDNNEAVLVLAKETGELRATWADLRTPHDVSFSSDENRALVTTQLGLDAPIFSIETNVQAGAVPLANSYYQSTDTALRTVFVTAPFTNGGTVAIVDQTRFGDPEQALAQTLNVPGAYYAATNPSTHATYVTSINSRTLTKITIDGPVVTEHPQDATIEVGENATFSAAAAGSTPMYVQWQLSDDNGNSWTNIVGATDGSYTIGAAQSADSGNQYRAVFANSAGAVETRVATLTVRDQSEPSPTPTATPTNTPLPQEPGQDGPSGNAGQDFLPTGLSTSLLSVGGLLLILAGIGATTLAWMRKKKWRRSS